jgi:hypothetical protein
LIKEGNMFKFLIFLLFLVVPACGTNYPDGRWKQGPAGSGCVITEDTEDYTVIRCGTKETVITKGKDGEDGEDAAQWIMATVQTSSCANGGYTILMALDSNQNEQLDTDDFNMQSAEVCNGAPGADGADGADGQTGPRGETGPAGQNGADDQDGLNFGEVESLNPCGDAAGVVDETLLKLSNGSVIGTVKTKGKGGSTFLTILPPGNYTTNDSDKCKFTINADGSLSHEHH